MLYLNVLPRGMALGAHDSVQQPMCRLQVLLCCLFSVVGAGPQTSTLLCTQKKHPPLTDSHFLRAASRRRNRRTRISGGAALSSGISDGVPGSNIPAAHGTTAAFAHADDNKVAGSASAELRAWQAAMLELARRHSAKKVRVGMRRCRTRASLVAAFSLEASSVVLGLGAGDCVNTWREGRRTFAAVV